MNQFGETFNCCRCNEQFKNTTELYQHYEMHKIETIVIENKENCTEIENMNISNDSEELLYILDGSQCINEVVIEQESVENQETSAVIPENFTIVQVEHGYVLPSVFKGKLGSKRRYKKRGDDSEDESEEVEIVITNQSESRNHSSSKSRPKRRHEVPDFSATNYIVLSPNEDVDADHYKCLRCEQLFISKFAFFRHIEKGKCFINSCDACSASFTQNSEFYDHYLAEHTDRAICNFCFRTFMYEKNVKEHMLRHLDQFRHRCEQCNKGFYTVREYRNHYKNIHMGIRHTCDVCGRSFADEYYFKRHVAAHEKANTAVGV